MKQQKLNIITSIILTILIVIGCSKEDSEDINNDVPSFPIDAAKKEILKTMADQLILPNNQQFVQDLTLLKSSINSFTQNAIATNLTAVQNQWRVAQNQWQLINLYEFGPIAQQFLFFKIDSWPSNNTFISGIINGTDSISSALIESKGSTTKGLPAIENLVFSLNNGDQAVLDSFNVASNHQRRKQYLDALAENLQEKGMLIDSIWDVNRGDYYTNFINNTENSIAGSPDVYLNNVIELLGYIIITKIEKPLGTGVTKPELSESFESQNSIQNIYQNITAIDLSFNGDASSSNSLGFDDLLNQYNVQKDNQLLTNLIRNKIDSVRLSIDQLSTNSIHLAVDNEPIQLNEVLKQFKDLEDLMRIDVANALNVIVTFSGNDGD